MKKVTICTDIRRKILHRQKKETVAVKKCKKKIRKEWFYGFSLDISIPVLTVFLQGVFSFFSPCVLPLIPLYMGYLSGGTGELGEDGRIHYERRKVMIHTVCFVVGVSFAFFILGLGASALGSFLQKNQMLFCKNRRNFSDCIWFLSARCLWSEQITWKRAQTAISS